jgi:hypothetical protein
VLAALAATLAPRARRVAAVAAAVALYAAPPIVRELAGPTSAGAVAFAGLSPFAAFDLIARDARGPSGAAWRESTRAGLTAAHALFAGLGAAAVIASAALKYKRSRGVVR